jgi:cyclopropane-fatty-acyl-phospholipid synthase
MSTDLPNAANASSLTSFQSAPSHVSRLFSRLFGNLAVGTLVVELPSGQQVLQRAALPGPEAVIKLNRWRGLTRLVAHGDLGFAEGYMDGDWTTPDPVTLFAWAELNEKALAPAWRGSRVRRIADRLVHALRANTRRGSKQNIAHHYDLGNDFYAAWLDESMSYSSALFTSPEQGLAQAQSAKIDRAIELLDAKAGQAVLEIGCGWGALAQRLVSERNCSVTGITLSTEQKAVAERRLAQADPSGRSSIRLQDYRDVSEQYDRIVSIEMFEAVGEAYWTGFFETIKARLRPGGVAVLQIISISKDRFDDYRRRPDFIQRYIFPGGMLPTVEHIETLTKGAGLSLAHMEHFGESYARTLAAWRTRFLKAHPALSGACASQRFKLMWDYYLAYCEAGFRSGAINVGLYRITNEAS